MIVVNVAQTDKLRMPTKMHHVELFYCYKLNRKLKQYPAIHTIYMLCHCTTYQYNHYNHYI